MSMMRNMMVKSDDPTLEFVRLTLWVCIIALGSVILSLLF